MTEAEKRQRNEEFQRMMEEWNKLTPQERLRPLIEKGLIDEEYNIVEGPIKTLNSNGKNNGH